MQNLMRLFLRRGKSHPYHHSIVTHLNCYWKESKEYFRASITDIDCYGDICFYEIQYPSYSIVYVP